VFLRIGVERILDLLARLLSHASMKNGNAFILSVGTCDRSAKLLLQVSLCIRILREDHDSTRKPGSRLAFAVKLINRGELRAKVVAYPVYEDTYARIRCITSLLSLGSQAAHER
jgi:hypothetical protein